MFPVSQNCGRRHARRGCCVADWRLWGAAAAALAVNQAGTVSVKTVVLIPPEDMDKVAKKSVEYRPPGR